LKQLLILSILLASLATDEAKAVSIFKDGNTLYSECASPADSLSHLMCLSYLQGVADADAGLLGVRSGTTADPHWCAPDRVTVGQAVDVIVRYLRDNPQFRHYPAAGLVAEALSQTWPCPAGVK
jgi:hypothetical protein